MLKKIALTTVVLLLVLAQAQFIYSLQHDEAKSITDLWASFNVSQTEYSKFVFQTIKWWWSLPGLCLLLLALALARPTFFRSTAAVAVSLFGSLALYWSVYTPALLIKL